MFGVPERGRRREHATEGSCGVGAIHLPAAECRRPRFEAVFGPGDPIGVSRIRIDVSIVTVVEHEPIDAIARTDRDVTRVVELMVFGTEDEGVVADTAVERELRILGRDSTSKMPPGPRR